MFDLSAAGAGHDKWQSYDSPSRVTAGQRLLHEAVSTRVRKRRCFADTELDAVMLERERSHDLLATRRVAVSASLPQQPVLLRLPTIPFQLPLLQMTSRQPDEAALRLIGLVRSWRTAQSESGIPLPSSGCQSDLLSKPISDHVDGNLSRRQPRTIAGLPLPCTATPSTLGGLPIRLPLVHMTTQTGNDEGHRCLMVNQSSHQPSSSTDATTGRDRHLLATRICTKDRQFGTKSLRTTKTFDFSVESLLAK